MDLRYALRVISLVMAAQAMNLPAAEPPVIPVGADAYRMWERWPYQRIGARAYMRSTYDRRGGNEAADASHFLYQEADDFNVTLDVEGPGVLYFARYNHWHGSPWHYEVDGKDHIVQETSTADPTQAGARTRSSCRSGCSPKPLAWTWSDTKGADLMWVPIAVREVVPHGLCPHASTAPGYYIYHQFVRGRAALAADQRLGRRDAARRATCWS